MVYQQQQQYNRGQYTPARRQQSAPANTAGARANTDNLVAILSKPAQQEQFRRALGNMIPVERFVRVCQTALRQTPKLASSTPESFMSALMQCAQLGLEPNTPQGLAYLVPYFNKQTNATECQIQIGYKGLLELMWRSGMVESINADVVYRQEIEQGLFEYESGMRVMLRHKINLLDDIRSDNDDDIVAAYACATLKSGQVVVRVLTRKELDQARKMSASGGGPWKEHYKSMALKTAIRRLASWVPTTPASEAIAIEDSYARQAENVTGEVVTQEKPQKPVVQIDARQTTTAIQQNSTPKQEQPAEPQPEKKRTRKPKAEPIQAQAEPEPQSEPDPIQEAQEVPSMDEPPVEEDEYMPEPPAEERSSEGDEKARARFHQECIARKLSKDAMIGAYWSRWGKCSKTDAMVYMGEDEAIFSTVEAMVIEAPGRYSTD